MYLFVFVFLVLSLMGSYTEMIALRMSQMSGKQIVAAETMMVWHGAQYEFVRNSAIPVTSFTSECSLTETFGAACTDGAIIYQMFEYTAAPPAAMGGRNYLPAGYDYTNIKWRTMYFVDGAASFIITYLLPNERRLGYSSDEIYAQMKKTSIPQISYGRVGDGPCIGGAVAGRMLITSEFLNGVQVCYPLPAAIANESVGIISMIRS